MGWKPERPVRRRVIQSKGWALLSTPSTTSWPWEGRERPSSPAGAHLSVTPTPSGILLHLLSQDSPSTEIRPRHSDAVSCVGWLAAPLSLGRPALGPKAISQTGSQQTAGQSALPNVTSDSVLSLNLWPSRPRSRGCPGIAGLGRIQPRVTRESPTGARSSGARNGQGPALLPCSWDGGRGV